MNKVMTSGPDSVLLKKAKDELPSQKITFELLYDVKCHYYARIIIWFTRRIYSKQLMPQTCGNHCQTHQII